VYNAFHLEMLVELDECRLAGLADDDVGADLNSIEASATRGGPAHRQQIDARLLFHCSGAALDSTCNYRHTNVIKVDIG
jgi:hypothetical protein